MALQTESGQSDKKKRKKQKPSPDSDPKQSPPVSKKSRKKLVEDAVLEKYHQSQKLQGILRRQQHPDDIDPSEFPNEEELDAAELSSAKVEPKTIQLSAHEQQEADQVLDDVNKLRKEKKKKLAKEKKKFKQQQKLQQQLAAEEQKESKQDKALAYLKQWKRHRDEWKFKKINHIWLLKNWKHSSKVPDKRFKTFLKYIRATEQKSLALQRLEQEAKAIVDKSATVGEAGDEQEADCSNEEANQGYQRARSILQWIV